MSELLLELFSEEIPAKMQSRMANLLKDSIALKLKEAEIGFENINYYATPRRITIYIQNFIFQTSDLTEEKKGPKIDAPDSAISGFAKSCAISKEDLLIKDGYYFGVICKKAKNKPEDIALIVNQSIADLVWPKSMKWASYDIRWVRPLVNILCVYNSSILPVSFGHLTANDKSFGHRFLGSEFTVTDFADYAKKLNDNFVVLDGAIRKKTILDQSKEICDSLNITLKQDDQLLEEIIGLVEYPVVLSAKIDQQFMDIPKEVLITTVKTHQKYFATENKDGSLAPYCLIVANIKTGDQGRKIIEGNERVLRARLSDARFFYLQDLKTSLEEMGSNLSNIIYHQRVGTIADKISHMLSLVDVLGGDKDFLIRAITLCKSDLVSGMVGEFPELQGIMGYYYAKHAGENELVYNAIRDHYKPLGQDDQIPKDLGALVAIADKITSIVSMFFVGEKPTGSKDPLALRRAAIGIIRIIIDNKLKISLNELVKKAADKLPNDKKIIDEIMLFFVDRFKNIIKDQNIRHDVMMSVLSNNDIDDLVDVRAKLSLLNNFVETIEGQALVAIYKRANNIVKDQSYESLHINQQYLIEQIEQKLFTKINEISSNVNDAISNKNYQMALNNLGKLVAPINEFFDQILVNVEDKNIRDNRLKLLISIVELIKKIADFSVIEG
jgi:glycyl-tRNA synthetase beta chain